MCVHSYVNNVIPVCDELPEHTLNFNLILGIQKTITTIQLNTIV